MPRMAKIMMANKRKPVRIIASGSVRADGGSGAGMGGRGFVEDGASLLVAPTPATRLTGRVGRSTDTARIDCGSGGSAATALLKDCASSPADCGRLTGDFSSADR